MLDLVTRGSILGSDLLMPPVEVMTPDIEAISTPVDRSMVVELSDEVSYQTLGVEGDRHPIY